MTVNLGIIASTTLQNYRKTLADNIFKDNVLLNHFQNNGGIEYKDGGRSIVVPVMYGTNTTVETFTGTDTLDLTYQNGIDAAEYNWALYNVNIVISLEDEAKNAGRSQVVDLLKAKIMQAENSLKERINNDFFNGTSANKEIVGLQTAVDTGTYGGIAGGTYSWWRSYVDSAAGALGIDDIRTGLNTVNNGAGGSKVSIMVTTQALHEKYESLLTTTINYESASTKEMKRLGDAGFLALGFRGIPVVFDEQTPSGEFYFLNTENLKIAMHNGYDFKVIDKGEPTNQHISVQSIVTMLQSVVNRRASLGKLTGKTVS